MKKRGAERGQVMVLIIIVIALLAGGYWMLLSSRTESELDAHRFARDASQRLILQHDMRFLNQTLTPHAQVLYPPSWRERFFSFVSDLGPVQGELNVHGKVTFTSEFFAPAAIFHTDFNATNGPASLELHFTHPAARWEIDALNLTWSPPPTPTPAPFAAAAPSVPASASPAPSAKPRQRK